MGWNLKKACKKICKEICRPFRQSSRFIGKTMKNIGFKKLGDFIENSLNVMIDTIAMVGASLYGGPIGVSAMSALLASSKDISDKDIFKASLLGGASAFINTLTNNVIIAKSAGMIMNSTMNKGNIKGIAYGVGDLIYPSNPLLVATIKTIAEKDIESGLLHVVGFETGKYVQAYINTSNAINKHIKDENSAVTKNNASTSIITKSIKKDIELYNFVKNELIEPYEETLKTEYVNKDEKIKKIFNDVHKKINDSTWKLKTSIAMKTNKINSSLTYQISKEYGLYVSADINKYAMMSVNTDDSAVGAGLSDIYPRGFVVKYSTYKKINSSPISVSDKYLDKTTKKYCYATKTYNTFGTDAVKLTTEYHINTDCAVMAGVGATVAIVAPATIPATVLMVPSIALADDKKSLSYKINSGKNPKLNYKISEMLNSYNIKKMK